ncbi:MAG: hypothetical protein V4555_19125 [Acidobacteriota bacterium]
MRLRSIAACLPLLLAPAAQAAAPHWTQVRSPHFLVLTDASVDQARQLAGQFERMRSLFLAILPATPDDPSPIQVLALKNRSEFTALEPPAYLAKGSLPLSGYFLHAPDRAYILLNLDSTNIAHPFAAVYHEYTHFALRKAEWLPLWLSEGLAEFYESSTIESHEAIVGEISPSLLGILRSNRLIPLQALLTADAASPYYHEEQKGSMFYAQSWALTHMLQADSAQHHTHLIEDYSALLRDHHDPVTSATQVFGPLDQLQRRLDHYVAQFTFRTFPVAAIIPTNPANYPATPISDTDATTLRAGVLTWDGRTAEARALLDEVLKRDPHNAAAVEAMGSLCNARHDGVCAKKWYGEAVQLNSASYVALYFYANASMEDRDTGHDAEIESSLRSAIRIAPSYAPAYDCLARFDVQQRRNLPEARAMSVKAVELEPDVIAYRLNLAAVLLQRQESEVALAALDDAMHVARTPEDVENVQTMIGQVKHFQQYLKSIQAPVEATKPSTSK